MDSQAAAEAVAAATRALVARAEDAAEVPACEMEPADEAYLGLRIASIFVIFVGGALGALLPVWLARTSRMRVPKHLFFVAKYFGSGVILATAFMHLVSPAEEALGNPCLKNILPDYDWAMAIALMTIMVMFLVELLMAHLNFGQPGHSHGHGGGAGHGHGQHGHGHGASNNSTEYDPKRSRQPSPVMLSTLSHDVESGQSTGTAGDATPATEDATGVVRPTNNDGTLLDPSRPAQNHIRALSNDVVSYPPGDKDHLGHQRDHTEGDSHAAFAARMTSIFILEFGVVFHSIFVGLTLAVTDNFVILFVVLIFHQTFEGLGLGARLATAPWPAGRRQWTPYVLGLVFAVSTPLSIAVGLGVRQSLALDAARSKIVNGVFDSISGGILMYTGLVELLAHEFMFNPEMRQAGLRLQLQAYGCVALGVALMALLAKWA